MASTPKLGNVIELLGDTGQIAGTILVRIEKASGIDLVDDCSTPPF